MISKLEWTPGHVSITLRPRQEGPWPGTHNLDGSALACHMRHPCLWVERSMGPKDCAHLESSSPLPTLTNGFLPLLRASADLIPKSILEGVKGTTGGKTPGHRVTKDQLDSLGCPHCWHKVPQSWGQGQGGWENWASVRAQLSLCHCIPTRRFGESENSKFQTGPLGHYKGTFAKVCHLSDCPRVTFKYLDIRYVGLLCVLTVGPQMLVVDPGHKSLAESTTRQGHRNSEVISS